MKRRNAAAIAAACAALFCLGMFAGCDTSPQGGENCEHVWDSGKITTPPTCTKEGVKTFTCVYDASHTRTETVPVDKDAHEWDEGEITTPATCTEAGERTFTCKYNAKHTKTETVAPDANAHVFSEEWARNDEKHWHEATCGHAEKQGEENHVWTAGEVLTAPNCMREGSQLYTCICGATKTETLQKDANVHRFSNTWEQTDEGHYHLANCGHEAQSELIPHTFDEGRVTRAPDCGVAGEKLFTCTACKYTKTEPIPAKEHTYDKNTWLSDAEGHWNPPTCAEESGVDHSDARGNFAPHTEQNGKCTVCGFVRPLLTYEVANGEATVTGFAEGVNVSEVTALYIPDTYEEKPVTAIKAGSRSACTFQGAVALQTISLPKGLVSIGNYAFEETLRITDLYFRGTLEEYLNVKYGSYNSHPFGLGIEASILGTDELRSNLYIGDKLVTEVVLPESVTAIPDYAFYRCNDIAKIDLTSSVLKSIGARAFGYLDKIPAAKVPSTVTSIGKGAFAMCRSLEEMVLPFVGGWNADAAGENTLFGYIFNLCDWASVDLPTKFEGFYHVQQSFDSKNKNFRQFYAPEGLKSVTIEGGKLFYGAFRGMKELTALTVPTDLTEIPARCFEGCEKIAAIDIGQSVEIVGDSAFNGMKALSAIDLGTRLTTIGTGAFTKSAIESIRFPATLRTVGKTTGSGLSSSAAFMECTNLKKVYTSSLADWCKIVFYGTARANNPLSPANAELYVGGSETPLTDLVIPQEITKLSGCAFAGCKGLKTITVGEQVTFIGQYCFEGIENCTVNFLSPENWEQCNQENSKTGEAIDASDLQNADIAAFNTKFKTRCMRKKS